MSIGLSKRLAAVAARVPDGARVIDVGTDHARLPVWLAQRGRAAHVFASDIRPGPLAGAAALVEQTGVGDTIALRLTDGLRGFSRADADTVVIAGMGGETMAEILSGAPWAAEDVLLILSPQSKEEVLRAWLCGHSFAIESEALVSDAGRLYPILTARGGAPLPHTPAELYTGRFEAISSDPLFPERLAQYMRRAEKAAPYDPAQKALLAGFQTMKERL